MEECPALTAEACCDSVAESGRGGRGDQWSAHGAGAAHAAAAGQEASGDEGEAAYTGSHAADAVARAAVPERSHDGGNAAA